MTYAPEIFILKLIAFHDPLKLFLKLNVTNHLRQEIPQF